MRGSCNNSDNFACPSAVSLSSTPKRVRKRRFRFDKGIFWSASLASSTSCCKCSRKVSHVATTGTFAPDELRHGRWHSACFSFNMDCERAYGTKAPSE